MLTRNLALLFTSRCGQAEKYTRTVNQCGIFSIEICNAVFSTLKFAQIVHRCALHEAVERG